ncbi:zinc finger BED domain-containing protein DAYSLEEPER-like [Lycium barbarum]|uniref:zinc finger BED domain-containing protein DAYSLEEPER-like n=1 Tax=Lycium barbarum TaxID=112863 RepID=UPI00293F55AD|nr:zinc finger BED domain-containing protein DAYSLEEPER-like [Lycium barbarum]
MADETKLSVVDSTGSIPNTDDTDSNDNSLDTQVTKKRKEMQSRFVVWGHFEKIVVQGIDRVKCKYCKKDLAAVTVNETTGLRQHLLRCNAYKSLIKPPTQKKIHFPSKDKNKIEDHWEFDQQLIRRALVEMIIIDELPFSFIEKEGFKKFMSQAQPLFQIPSHSTITRDCYERYNELRQNLKKYFREAHSKVCLTTDTWTSLQKINYMCLTAHFIDKDWKLHKIILNFFLVTSLKGEHMAETISNCLLHWNLDKVFTITVDNASSNDVTVR